MAGDLERPGQARFDHRRVDLDSVSNADREDAAVIIEAAIVALPSLVAGRASKGKAAAKKAAAQLADRLSEGLRTLINTFNPSLVIIGGMMRPVVQQQLDRIRASVAATIVPGMFPPDIRLSSLDEF